MSDEHGLGRRRKSDKGGTDSDFHATTRMASTSSASSESLQKPAVAYRSLSGTSPFGLGRPGLNSSSSLGGYMQSTLSSSPPSSSQYQYRGIPLGAVAAAEMPGLRDPLMRLGEPRYRSLGVNIGSGVVAQGAPASPPVYRSLGVMPPHAASASMSLGEAFSYPPAMDMGMVSSISKASSRGAVAGTKGKDPFARPVMKKSPDPFAGSVQTPESTVGATGAGSRVTAGLHGSPPALPPAPFFLDRCSHFFSAKPARELVRHVDAFIAGCTSNASLSAPKAFNSDATFNPSKWKWKVNVYSKDQCHRVSAKIKVFAAPGSVTAVECLRRKGDNFLFFDWYRKLLASLKAKGFLCDPPEGSASCSSTSASSCDEKTSAVPAPVPAVSLGTDPATLQPLKEMYETGYADVQVEAARQLASLSSAVGNRTTIIEAGFARILVALLRSHDRDVHRCAAVALANLAETRECQSAVLDAGAQTPLCALLTAAQGKDGSTAAVSMECRRASARALANLIRYNAAAMQEEDPTSANDDDNDDEGRSSPGLNALRQVWADGRCVDARLRDTCSRALGLVQ